MIPEFIGRFPVTVAVEKLELEDLTRILIEPKNSLLQQMQWYFAVDEIDLEFEDQAILAIAQQALTRGLGARGLKTIIERCLMTTMYSLNDIKSQGISKVKITENVVLQNQKPELIKHER